MVKDVIMKTNFFALDEQKPNNKKNHQKAARSIHNPELGSIPVPKKFHFYQINLHFWEVGNFDRQLHN